MKNYVTAVPRAAGDTEAQAKIVRMFSGGTWLKLHQQFQPTVPVPAGIRG